MPEDSVEKFIRDNIHKKSTIIVAVSGGPDSMYLLNRLINLKTKLHLKIIIAHINHGLRGKSSDKDQQFVEKYAKKHHLVAECVKVKLDPKANLEEAGRDARYAFLEKMRKKHDADWILTAHHNNDNIETVLFNLIRGAHIGGLKGIEAVSKERHLLRPLLGITKKEILAYNKQKRIPSRTDASNQDVKFSRNWLRTVVIPQFSRINSNFENTLGENLRNFAQMAEYMEKEAEKWLGNCKKDYLIPAEKFLDEHVAFQKNLIVHLYKKTHGSTKKLTNHHLDEILKVIGQKKANRKKEFGPLYFIEIVKDGKGKRMIRIIKPRHPKAD